ncbi:MAG: DUF2752 domain-containing protein [Myxococcota bacterium]
MNELLDRLDKALLAPVRWLERFSDKVQDRIVGAILFVPSATVLGIALSLTPDPAGLGTHRQLGLGGCTILTMTGVPCPMCGMTTTFTHLAHLHLWEGVVNQPFGLVLFSLTVLVAVIGGLDLIRPGRRWKKALSWIDDREGPIAYGLLGGMLAGWAYKVFMVNGLPPW